ncbi:MAG: SRPBCC family protein [Marinifilaceae bacterium]
MKLFKPIIISDSIEINTSPERIWEFFTNLEENYKAWHPQDHIVFKWTRGKPMETGSRWYGEEVVRGKLYKLKGCIGEVIPNRKIVFKYSFPFSIVAPWFDWTIETKGASSIFTARSCLRAGGFYQRYFKKHMVSKLEIYHQHVKEEGENLKRILES